MSKEITVSAKDLLKEKIAGHNLNVSYVYKIQFNESEMLLFEKAMEEYVTLKCSEQLAGVTELPSITDLQNEFINYPNRTQMVSEIMLKLKQASLVIAKLKEDIDIFKKGFEALQQAMLLESKKQSDEKDSLIETQKKELEELREKLKQK